MQRKDSGFTLIELIVVIGIITVLAAILFPVIFSARQKANQSSCLNNVRQIAIAIQIYTNDNNNIFPSMTTIWQGLNLSNKTYICPAIGKKLQNGYGYNYSLNNQLLSDADNITNPSQIVEVADCRKNSLYPNIISTPGDIDYRHNGFASFGFVDGHVCSLNSCPNLPLFSYVDLAASWLPIPIGSQYSPGWAYNAVDDGAYKKFILDGRRINQDKCHCGHGMASEKRMMSNQLHASIWLVPITQRMAHLELTRLICGLRVHCQVIRNIPIALIVYYPGNTIIHGNLIYS